MSSFGYNVLGFGANANSVVLPSDDEFNRVSFLSHFDGANNGVNNAFDDGSASNHTINDDGNVTQGSFGPFAREEGYWSFNNAATENNTFKVTSHDNFDMTNPFTIEGWIFIPDLSANKLLFGRENNYWMTHDYQGIGGASGKFGFNYQNSGSWAAINASAATVANTWYFLQATYVGTTVTFYVNGASQGTASVGSPSSNTNKDFYVLSMSNVTHAGNASNVRLSSVARSTSLPTDKFTSDSDTELLICQSNRFVDNGPDGHTITTTAGAAVSAFGPFLTTSVYDPAVNGASAYFDGADDFLTVSDSADLTPGNTFTFDAWIYPQVLNNYNTIMSQDGSTGYYWSILANGTLQFYTGGGGGSGGTHNSASGVVQLNQWNHVAYSVSGGTGYHFVNGVRSGSSHSNDIPNIAENLLVGVQKVSSFDLYGYGTDYRLVVGTALYTGSTYTIPTAPLTAITNTKLLLNMADGQAIDSAAQNNLTLYGNTKLSTTQAKFGDTSMYFDGTDDFAILNNSEQEGNLGSGDWTIEGWLFITANAGTANDEFAVASKWGGGSTRSWLARIVNGNKLTFWYINTSGTQVELTSDSRVLSLNTWYHVAWVKNSNLKVYLNGTAATLASSDFQIRSGTDAVQLSGRGGADGDDNMYQGYIDDFRISKFARYTSNFTAPSAPFPDKGQQI